MPRKMKFIGAFLLADSQQAIDSIQTIIMPKATQYIHRFLIAANLSGSQKRKAAMKIAVITSWMLKIP